jgi:hypothetical protein
MRTQKKVHNSVDFFNAVNAYVLVARVGFEPTTFGL